MTDEFAPSDWLPANARPPRAQAQARRGRAHKSSEQGSPSEEVGWEYKAVRVPSRNQRRAHAKALTKMSDKGWELVSVNWGGLLRATDIATFRRRR